MTWTTDLDLLLPFKRHWIKTWTCITLARYEKYRANFATNNINAWFVTHHTLSAQGKLDLTVLYTAQQIIQESFHTFLMTSLLS